MPRSDSSMSNAEDAGKTDHQTHKAMTTDTSLSDVLASLLVRAREANKLGKDGAHDDHSHSREDHVSAALSATEAQNKTTKVTHTASVVMGTGSPVPHIAIPEETVGSPETPSRRLNPIAPTYTPDPPQSAQLAAQVRTNELRAQHTRQQAQQQAQVQRAYYEAQFHKAYRDGVVRGRHEGAQMAYDAGFSAGQRYANAVAAKRLISNTVTNTDNQMKADEGKGGSTSGV